jgi:hypothetical protein
MKGRGMKALDFPYFMVAREKSFYPKIQDIGLLSAGHSLSPLLLSITITTGYKNKIT